MARGGMSPRDMDKRTARGHYETASLYLEKGHDRIANVEEAVGDLYADMATWNEDS